MLKFLGQVSVALAFSLPAQAAFLSQVLTPLGGEQWEYNFTAHNEAFDKPVYEVTVFFPLDSFASIAAIDSPVGWDGIAIQANPAIPADGFYDAMTLSEAVRPGDSLGTFTVRTLASSGVLLPEALMFEFRDADFSLLASGYTTQGLVPEPMSWLMLTSGLVFLVIRRANRRQALCC